MSVGNFFKYGTVGTILGGGAGMIAGGALGVLGGPLAFITVPLGAIVGGIVGAVAGGAISSIVGAFTSSKSKEAPAGDVEVVHVRGNGYAMAQDVPDQESTRFREMVAQSRGGQRTI